MVGLGGVVAGSGAALGSGAFTSVNASRDVSVTVTNEDTAYLAIEPAAGPNSGIAQVQTNNQNELRLDINGDMGADNEDFGGDGDSHGIGTDSVYTFDNVFSIKNQGTQPITVSASFTNNGTDLNNDLGGDPLGIRFYAGSNSGTELSQSLNVGDSVAVGIWLDSDSVDFETQSITATISANAN